jgi:hypothetical protein
MKGLINFHKQVGTGMKSYMDKPGWNMIKGIRPPIEQTIGRLQYYRAENEPFVPDSVKWAIRMPERHAMREYALTYQDEVIKQCQEFYNEHYKHDLLDNRKDIDVTKMTLRECERLAVASQHMHDNQESLFALQEECAKIDVDVQTTYLKIVEMLDRTAQQINETEEQTYGQVREHCNNQLRSHEDTGLMAVISLQGGSISLENLAIVEKVAETNAEMANHASQLRSLALARAQLLNVRDEVMDAFSSKVDMSNKATAYDSREAKKEYEQFHAQVGADYEQVSGDAKIFKDQVDTLRSGDVKTLLEQID